MKKVSNIAKRIIRKRSRAQGFLATALTAIILSFGLVIAVPAFVTLAFADDQTLDVETNVALFSESITPLNRISYTANGELITINEGDSLVIEASFEGGEGTLTYSWEISRDGGESFESINSTDNFLKIESAQPHSPGIPYVYRLYAFDESIQRLETLFTVMVVTSDDPPSPTPITPDSESLPGSYSSDGGTINAKTEDPSIVFIVSIACISIMSFALAVAGKRKDGEVSDKKVTDETNASRGLL